MLGDKLKETQEVVELVPPSEAVDAYLKKMGFFQPEDAQEVIEEIFDPLMEKLPSRKDPKFQNVKNSFSCRTEYITKFGYVLMSDEVSTEIKDKLDALGVSKFIELGAGTGFLTKVLIDRGFSGMGYTLPIPEGEEAKKKHWGLGKEGMYNFCVENEMLELVDMKDLINIAVPELVVSAWVPYGGGEEVIDFFDTNGYPLYYLVIGEGYSGCTANDTYHDWLEEKYEREASINSYESFSGMHDDISIYKKKEQ